MDPNNQTVNQQTPVVPQAPVVQPPQAVPPNAPKSNKKLMYGVLLGLITVIIVSAVGFYMLNSPKTENKVAVAPTPIPTPVEEAADVPEVTGVSDLDNFIVGLAEADSSLDTELAKFETDSNF